MAQRLDDHRRNNGTHFDPHSSLSHLQTCLSFLKPGGTETVGTPSRVSDLFANHFGNSRIIRIIFIVPAFAVISFLCVWQDGSPAPYIAPGLGIGEALPMAAFFLLMSTYVVPDERNRDDYFTEMALLDKKGAALGGGSLKWYRVSTSTWPSKTKVGTDSKLRNTPSVSSNGYQSASFCGSQQLSAWL